MKIKKFKDYNLNESIEDIFDREYTYKDSVKSHLIAIIAKERGISEKSFSLYDEVMNEVDNLLDSGEFDSIIKECESNNYRSEYCAEIIYAKKYY